MGVTPKAASAGLSAVGTVPLATVVIWLIEMIPTHADPYHVVVPAAVAAALSSLVAAGAAFVGAYIAPRSDPTPEQVTTILQTNAMQQPKL